MPEAGPGPGETIPVAGGPKPDYLDAFYLCELDRIMQTLHAGDAAASTPGGIAKA